MSVLAMGGPGQEPCYSLFPRRALLLLPFLMLAALDCRLTIAGSGTGSGSVTTDPGGATCTITAGAAGTGCSQQLDFMTEVTLTAMATGGSRFAGWSGDCAEVVFQLCKLIMLLNRGVTARFDPDAAARLAAGGWHSCALTAAGGVKCWGWNAYGQLGNGSNNDSNTPVDVSGLGAGVAAIAAGGRHSCALTAGGAVKCWGGNGAGQLGNGSNHDSNTPVDASGLGAGVAAIAAGPYHTCALTTGGGAKCWGGNWAGQLGNSSNHDSNTPVDVAGLTAGVVAIVGGRSHTCALTAGGGVKCWGYNGYGQLGNGSNNDSNTPVDVAGLTAGVVAIASGRSHTCALTAGGGVKCWGGNFWAQLGNGSTTNSNTPVDVSGLSASVAAIATGWYHSCALTAGGGLKCWGWNVSGQLGNGSTTSSNTPVDVSGLTSGVAAVAAGWAHSCALTAGGGLRCWGSNGSGQLGDGSNNDSNMPVDVTGF